MIDPALWSAIHRVAASDEPVLVRGDGAIARELVARIIHDHSLRRSAPFEARNASTLAAAVVEANSHGPPAITASAGTLFIEEIGVLDPAALENLLVHVPDGVRVVVTAGRAVSPEIEQLLARRLFARIELAPLPNPVEDAELDLRKNLECLERRLLRRALELSRGNRAQAARLLGIRRALLYARMKHLAIEDLRPRS